MIFLRVARSVKHLDWSSSLKRLVTPHRLTAPTLRSRSFRSANKETDAAEDDPSEPIKYSTSKAAQWTAAEGLGMQPSTRPKYEKMVVVYSLMIFMIYFLIFREENDIDARIGMTIQESLALSETKYNTKKHT